MGHGTFRGFIQAISVDPQDRQLAHCSTEAKEAMTTRIF